MPRFLSRIGAIGPAATAPLTIGTNTATSADGAYFGTDTPLYRAGANVLRCNQLDQDVLPVQSFAFNAETPSAQIGAGGAGVNVAGGSITMPFKGDLLLTGSVVCYTVANGLGGSQCWLTCSAGTLATNPAAWHRTGNPPGVGQEIWTSPLVARYTAVPAGATCTIWIVATNSGSVTLGFTRVNCLILATRTL